MARINHSEVVQQIEKGLGLSTIKDNIPVDIGNNVQVVYAANPQPQVKVARQTISDATAGTILVPSPTKRTFISSISLAVSKDAGNTGTHCYVRGTPKGGTDSQLLAIRFEPTTAGSHHAVVSFPDPIEIEKDVAKLVYIDNNTAIASIDITAIVTYFEILEV